MADTVLKTPEPRQIRAELEELVVNDLYGPIDGDPHEEFPTSERPTDRYILGRLAPSGAVIEPEEQDSLGDSGAAEIAGESEATTARTEDGDDEDTTVPSGTTMFCNAHGFTVCVEPDTTRLLARATWAHYENVPGPDGKGRYHRRVPHESTKVVELPEADTRIGPIELDPSRPGVHLRGRVRTYEGRRLVTLFLVNGQMGRTKEQDLWLFQAELTVTAAEGDRPVFVPRPESFTGGDRSDRAEQRNLAMTHRFNAEFAVGHSVAVDVVTAPGDRLRAVSVSTTAVPGHELSHTDVPSAEKDEDLPELVDLVHDMKTLGAEGEGAIDVRDSLSPLVAGYRSWIARQRQRISDPDARLVHDGTDHRDQARANLDEAGLAADRIAAAVDLLATDRQALAAFRFANRAMHHQRVRSIAAQGNSAVSIETRVAEADVPRNRSWRPFQLAFLLLNLPSLTDPAHPERTETSPEARGVADLLWFPTGGGKTEAYLGLTAYTLGIRRLQRDTEGEPDSGTGVAVLMRYTLRLLTLQQFQRATALICACEAERRDDEERWGTVPFRIGLWVGGKVTPNTFGQAEQWVRDKRRRRGSGGRGSPHQLSHCPWCGSEIDPGRDIDTERQSKRTRITCPALECRFGESASGGEGLPVLVVDEEIYRYVPSLIIATVDKFAQLTWKGEAQTLFGRADRYCSRHGYLAGSMWDNACGGSHQHTAVAKGLNLPAATVVPAAAVRPPDLIVQDELHLITGPLGSLVGLYETAVDFLAAWEHRAPHGRKRHKVRPKVIASTATVRRAGQQIGMLFAGRTTKVFPPQGLDAGDTFFSRQRPTDEVPGRRYVGLCAHGVRIKSAQIRVYVAVMAAAQKLHTKYGSNEVTDPYMTLVGYFNSLRDLGGMRRLVEDDVSKRLEKADRRGLAKRLTGSPTELTSRRNSDEIRPVLDRLGVTFPESERAYQAYKAELDKAKRERRKPEVGPGVHAVDVLLATNMIAVGVDVPRLGAMVVSGQPKSTAEYIQATSRVGRRHPGIVFTVYNWARPRDLSHYERFSGYHANLYRHVEALSVTPFAARAIDRGLTGLLVAMARGYDPNLNPNSGAGHFVRTGDTVDHVAAEVGRRAQLVAPGGAGAGDRHVRDEVDHRFDMWHREQARQPKEAFELAYNRGKRSVPLLRTPEDGKWVLRTCPTSLREVEPGIRLVLDPEDDLGHAEEPPFRPQYGGKHENEAQ